MSSKDLNTVLEEWSLKQTPSKPDDASKGESVDDATTRSKGDSGISMSSLANLLNLEETLDKFSNVSKSDLFRSREKTFGDSVHSDFVFQMVDSADPTVLKHGKKYGVQKKSRKKQRSKKVNLHLKQKKKKAVAYAQKLGAKKNAVRMKK